jgi:hypothetical protein
MLFPAMKPNDGGAQADDKKPQAHKSQPQNPEALKKIGEIEKRLSHGHQFLCGHVPSMDDKEALADVDR